MSESDESEYVDGYVFYQKLSSWKNVCELWQNGIVRFAAVNDTGPDPIVAFVGETRGPNAKAGRDAKLKKAEQAANPTFSSAKSTLITASAPSHWSDKQRYAAHLRITAEPGQARVVYDAFNPTGKDALFTRGKGYNGHALCEGDWDVLVELGADTPEALEKFVITARGVPGIKSVIVTTLKMERGQPKAPELCVDLT
jgi:hypothetical protein